MECDERALDGAAPYRSCGDRVACVSSDGTDATLVLGDSIWLTIIQSINHTSSLINENHMEKCVLTFLRNAMEVSRMTRMPLDKRIENRREPKNKYSTETKSGGIVRLRNC